MPIDGQYTIETPENVEVDFELAGPGSRFCAMIIDSLMMFLLMLLVGGLVLVLDLVFLGNLSRTPGPSGNRMGDWLTWVNALAILLLLGSRSHHARRSAGGLPLHHQRDALDNTDF